MLKEQCHGVDLIGDAMLYSR